MNIDTASRAAMLDPQNPRAQRDAQRLILRERGSFDEERSTLAVWRDFTYCEPKDKNRYWDCLAHLWIVSPTIGRQLHLVDRMKEAAPLLDNAGRILCSYTFKARDCVDRINAVPEVMDWDLPPGDSRRDWRMVVTKWAWMQKPEEYHYCGTNQSLMRFQIIRKLSFKFRQCSFCFKAAEVLFGRLESDHFRIKKSDAEMLRDYFAERHGAGVTERLIFHREQTAPTPLIPAQTGSR